MTKRKRPRPLIEDYAEAAYLDHWAEDKIAAEDRGEKWHGPKWAKLSAQERRSSHGPTFWATHCKSSASTSMTRRAEASQRARR